MRCRKKSKKKTKRNSNKSKNHNKSYLSGKKRQKDEPWTPSANLRKISKVSRRFLKTERSTGTGGNKLRRSKEKYLSWRITFLISRSNWWRTPITCSRRRSWSASTKTSKKSRSFWTRNRKTRRTKKQGSSRRSRIRSKTSAPSSSVSLRKKSNATPTSKTQEKLTRNTPPTQTFTTSLRTKKQFPELSPQFARPWQTRRARKADKLKASSATKTDKHTRNSMKIGSTNETARISRTSTRRSRSWCINFKEWQSTSRTRIDDR